MTDIEVHIDLAEGLLRAGRCDEHRAESAVRRLGSDIITDWLADPARFSLEPALTLGRGPFVPAAGLNLFGMIGDSAQTHGGVA